EAMPTSLQFLVQIVQQDVGQQRRQRPALRRADLAWLDALTYPYARAQVAPDQRQQPLVAHPPGHPGHQGVVLDVVEELLQVQIARDPIAGTGIGLYLAQRSMGASLGPKAKARFRKVRIED